MEISIREAKKEELGEVVRITDAAFNIPYQKEEYELKYKEPPEILVEEFESGKTKVLVALLGAEVVGAIRYRTTNLDKYIPHDKNSVEIFKLAVLKKYRKQRIGEKLMAKVERVVKEQGYPLAVLNCMLEENLPSYYQKLGYEEFRNVEHGDHHDIYMFKTL